MLDIGSETNSYSDIVQGSTLNLEALIQHNKLVISSLIPLVEQETDSSFIIFKGKELVTCSKGHLSFVQTQICPSCVSFALFSIKIASKAFFELLQSIGKLDELDILLENDQNLSLFFDLKKSFAMIMEGLTTINSLSSNFSKNNLFITIDEIEPYNMLIKEISGVYKEYIYLTQYLADLLIKLESLNALKFKKLYERNRASNSSPKWYKLP